MIHHYQFDKNSHTFRKDGWECAIPHSLRYIEDMAEAAIRTAFPVYPGDMVDFYQEPTHIKLCLGEKTKNIPSSNTFEFVSYVLSHFDQKLGTWQQRIKKVWTDLVTSIGKDDVHLFRENLEEIPNLRYDIFDTTGACIIMDNNLMRLGSLWFIEFEDVPRNWNELSLDQQQKTLATLLGDTSGTLASLETVKVFSRLIEGGAEHWENARLGVLAHELAHYAGAMTYYYKDFADTTRLVGRYYEMQADLLAARISPQYREGLLSHHKAILESLDGEEAKIQSSLIDITEQPSQHTHPTWAWRIRQLEEMRSIS